MRQPIQTTDAELYKEFGALTKDRARWEESIPYVASLRSEGTVKDVPANMVVAGTPAKTIREIKITEQ